MTREAPLGAMDHDRAPRLLRQVDGVVMRPSDGLAPPGLAEDDDA